MEKILFPCLFANIIASRKLPESLQFSYYIKDFVKRLTDWDGTEETKDQYRSEMQRLGTEIVRKQIDPKFFIKRTIEDIRVYSITVMY